MSEYKKVKIGDFLTESKEESFDSDASKRITVRLNCKGIEQRSLKAEKEGATKYFVRHSGQFIYGKQNFHKGAFGIIPEKLDGFTSSADLPAFDFTNTSCCPEYLNLWFQVDERYKRLQKNVKGVGSQRLAVSIFLNQEILLPDLETQKEIVKKVSTNLKNVEILTKEIESQKACAKQLRQNILQDAIEGKLTAEWRKKHPVIKGNPDFDAEALFEEIAAGKASSPSFAKSKTSKQLPPISDDEKPFNFCEEWKFARLDFLFDHKTGKTLNAATNKGSVLKKYITTSNLYWNQFDFENIKEMYFSEEEIDKYSVHKGDLLVCEGGDVGRSAIWNYDYSVCYQNHIHRLRARYSLNINFYYYILFLYKNSGYINSLAKGMGIQGLSANRLGAFVLPLPPLKEQEEIVNKVESLLNKVTELENQIQERKQLSEKLVFGVIKEKLER